MDRLREWLSQPFGKKLKRLHAWNAWLVLVLAVSGVILFMGGLRGELGAVRVWIKQAHIYLGLVSIVVLALYLPSIGRHLKQLRTKAPQRYNLGFVLFLLAGWIVSGLVLWQLRSLPPAWANTALIAHDLFTWVGVPYAVYHSISRSRWLKREEARARQAEAAAQRARRGQGTAAPQASLDGSAQQAPAPAASAARGWSEGWEGRRVARRTFLRFGVAAALAAVFGPSFYRWWKRTTDTGGASLEKYAAAEGSSGMLPAPSPLSDSLPPKGGGAQGNFREYTVTPFPTFTSADWSLMVSGLVEKQLLFKWEDFLKIPRIVQVSDFHCVTGWSVYHVTWEGIRLSELLNQAGVKPSAKFVKFYSGDGEYTDALTLEQARMEDVMVAVMLDGQPIPQKLGGPVRLVVPKMYGYKSVKWMAAIELIEEGHEGYWEVRGYPNKAWVPGLRTLAGVR